MHEVTNLDHFRKAKAKKERAKLAQAVPDHSWKDDSRLYEQIESPFIRAIVADALEQMKVDPNTLDCPMQPRVNVVINERLMRKEKLLQKDVFRGLRDGVRDVTARVPELTFMHPQTPDQQLQISIFLP